MSFYKNLFLLAPIFLLLTGCNNNQPDNKTHEEDTTESLASNEKLPEAIIEAREEFKRRPLKIGVSLDNPPMSFYKNGEAVGFEIELIHAIANILHCSTDFTDMPFDGLLASLKAGISDCVIAELDITPQREKQVSFTRAYYQTAPYLAFPNSSNIREIKDLKGLTVGVQAGSSHVKTLENDIKNDPSIHGDINIKELPKFTELLKLLENGQIACIIGNESPIQHLIEKVPNLTKLPLLSLQTKLAIALPKDSKLLNAFNDTLEILEKNGKLKDLKDKWGITDR